MRAIYESTTAGRHSSRWSTANLSFLAGAGSVLFVWWMQERRRRRDRDQYLYGLSDDLQLKQDENIVSISDNKCVYLDYNGTTPITSQVLQAMMPYLTRHFGNPSSGHVYGQAPRQAMDQARSQVLQLLGRPTADPSCIWFTACGTESDNMAIQCAIMANQHRFDKHNNETKPHIVTSNVEHPAIEVYLQHLEEEGICTVTYVPVQTDGRVKATDVIAAITPQTILVTLMLANNEVGALQPVSTVSQYCRQQNILFHTDAAQAAGKVSVDLNDALGDADMVTLVGHKLGAPKGVACLYVRSGCLTQDGRQMPNGKQVLLHGGGQEFGRRAGTPNVPYIVGFGHAAAEAAKRWPRNAKHMAACREYLLDMLQEKLGGSSFVKANGPTEPHHRLPNTLSVGLRGVHSGKLLQAVGDRVAASAGATCHSTESVSAVLKAMNVPIEWARGTLRLSVGPSSTFPEVEKAAQILADQVALMREKAVEEPAPK